MSSNQGNIQGNTGAGGQEKQDWLDKGIQKAGDSAGANISNNNADKAGDFANKEFDKKEGFNLPGVH